MKPEGTIGLHSVYPSVCQSVCPSVCLSHSFSRLFLAILSHFLMKVGSRPPFEELQIKFDFRHSWLTFSGVKQLLPFFKISFPHFFLLCFHISERKLVANIHMKSYRSTGGDYRFALCLSVCLSVSLSVRQSVCHTRFLDFSWLFFHISGLKSVAGYHWKSYRSSSTFVTVDLLFSGVIALWSKLVFRTFSCYAFTYLNES